MMNRSSPPEMRDSRHQPATIRTGGQEKLYTTAKRRSQAPIAEIGGVAGLPAPLYPVQLNNNRVKTSRRKTAVERMSSIGFTSAAMTARSAGSSGWPWEPSSSVSRSS